MTLLIMTAYKGFTYNINKCDIAYMFLYLLLQVKSLASKISYIECHFK